MDLLPDRTLPLALSPGTSGHAGGGGQTALVIWDESVIEKPESIALEGLGPVRSSKAARLKRIKPDYFNPPG